MEVTYSGFVQGTYQRVLRNAQPLALKPSLSLRSHSPTGFAWGYAGSGSAQLALALLHDATGSKSLALDHYQDFKATFLSAFPAAGGWALTRSEILSWLNGRINPPTAVQVAEEVPAIEAFPDDPPYKRRKRE